MRKHIALIGFVMLVLLLPSSLSALKIVSWNALDFSGDLSGDRVADFKKVLDELQPDILVIQDMVDAKGADLFLNKVLNHSKKLYKKAKFNDQTETATAFYYNKKTIKLTSTDEIMTLSRSMWGYTVKIKKGDGKGNTINVYSVHLAEGTSKAAKNARDADVALIRAYLDAQHQPGDFFVVCGTFNLAGTKDKAFKILTADAAVNNGRLIDPLGLKGRWHKKKKYREHFSESTRKMDTGVGASGGLDDRYDNFFLSQGLVDDEDFTLVEGSYIAYGNDGKHFKKAVTVPDNEIVAQDVAEALYRASDHLPIVMNLGPPGGGEPLPPSQLTAQAFSASGINLAWKDNATNEDGFYLSRARDCFDCHGSSHCNTCHGGFPGIPKSPVHEFAGHQYSYRQIVTLAPDVQAYSDTGLPSGAKFHYFVCAFNASGKSANSNEASATTNSSSATSKTEDK